MSNQTPTASSSNVASMLATTKSTMDSLSDPRLKIFSQFSALVDPTVLTKAWVTNIVSQSTLDSATEVDSKYFEIGDDVDYIGLKDAMLSIQPYLKVVTIDGSKNIYLLVYLFLSLMFY